MNDNQSLGPDDSVQPGPPAEPPVSPTVPPKRSFGRRHWGKLTLLTILLVPLAGLALWTVIGLTWTYAEGDRTGTMVKISRKGWLCKTWEGTLYMDVVTSGFRTDSFNFTVRNDSLAKEMAKLSGKRVAVEYKQHTLVPSTCFGDNEYFVSSVRVVPQ